MIKVKLREYGCSGGKDPNMSKGPPDTDEDGVISPEELYYHFDLDDDGTVTPDEYEEHVKWHAEHPEYFNDGEEGDEQDALVISLEEKKDRCYRLAKQKYDVFPSAYASGFIVRCRKGKVGRKKKANEELEEGVSNIFGKITYNIDKTFMYSTSEFPYVELVIPAESAEKANKLFTFIKNNKTLQRISNWRQKDNEIYTQIIFNDIPVAQRNKIFTHNLQRINLELEKVGIYQGAEKEPMKDDEYAGSRLTRIKEGTFDKEKSQGLHGWFARRGGKGKSKGWVDCNTCRTDKKTGRKTCKSCGRQSGESRGKYPACRPTPSACTRTGTSKKKSSSRVSWKPKKKDE